MPVVAHLVLATHVPHSEADVLVLHGLHVEACSQKAKESLLNEYAVTCEQLWMEASSNLQSTMHLHHILPAAASPMVGMVVINSDIIHHALPPPY